MYEYSYVDSAFMPNMRDMPNGAVFYDHVDAYDQRAARCVWMVPASEYPPL